MIEDDVIGVVALLPEQLVLKCGVDWGDMCKPTQLDVFWCWLMGAVGVIVTVVLAGVIVIKLLTE